MCVYVCEYEQYRRLCAVISWRTGKKSQCKVMGPVGAQFYPPQCKGL